MTAGALAAACSLFVDTDGLAGVGAGLDAAGATDGAGDAPFGEDAGDAGSNGDASAGDARCKAGLSVIAEPVGAPTETCDLGNALRRDGLSAGLDRKNDMMGPLIKDFEVSSCLQVDFGAPRAAKIRDRSREADGESLRHELPAFELRDGRRYVAVCRSNGGTMRDDIAVDVVELCD